MRPVLGCLAALLLAPGALHAQPAGTVKTTGPIVSPSIFVRMGLAEGLPQLNVAAIAQDSQGFLWFGTQEGLARYDGTAMKVFRGGQEPGDLSDSFITALDVDGAGTLWVGTLQGGVCRLDSLKQVFQCVRAGKGGLSSDSVVSLLADGKTAVWVGGDDGHLARIATDTLAVKDFRVASDTTPVTAIARGPDKLLWVGLKGAGLLRVDPDKGTVKSFRHKGPDSVAGDSINLLEVDRHGTFWIGTDKGLDRMEGSGSRFVHVSLGDDRSEGAADVTTLLSDSDGSTWVGTQHGLVRRDASGGITRFGANLLDPNSLPIARVVSSFQDRGGVRWFGTDSTGLSRVTDTRLAFGFMSVDTGGVVEEKNGNLWMGGVNPGGLWHYDFQRHERTSYARLALAGGGSLELLPNWITTMQRDASGVLWLGTRDAGMLAFDPRTDVAEQYTAGEKPDPAQLSSNVIWRTIRDREGMIDAATWGGGLTRIDPKARSFRTFVGEESGLSTDYLYSVFEDVRSPGILWLATAAGLNRLDTKTGKVTVWVHDAANPKSLSNDAVTTIAQTPDGILWLGTYGGGLNRFDPSSGVFQVMGKDDQTHETVLGLLSDQSGRLWFSTNGHGLVRYDPKNQSFRRFDHRDGLPDEWGQGGYYHCPFTGRLMFSSPVGAPGGYVRFDPASIPHDTYAPPVVLTSFKIFDKEAKLARPVWTSPSVDLSHKDSVISLEYSALSFGAPDSVRFAYRLEGLQDDWVETNRRFVTYANLKGGDYVFHVRAINRDGLKSSKEATLALHVAPPPWKTWWAYTLYGLAGLAVLAGVWRYQRQKLRNVEREGRLAMAERDIELTGAVQAGFLPKFDGIDRPGLHLSALYRPAQACSGDWWWHEQAGSIHWIVVGDVTGHGPGPAMVTAAAATAFRVQADLGTSDFYERMRTINTEVLRVGDGKYQMTLSAVALDENTGRFDFYSAGGLPVTCLRTDGKVKVFPCRGTPLGSPVFEMGKTNGELAPSDRLLVLTDGIPEIELPNGKLLGLRRLSEMLKSTQGMPVRQAVSQVLGQADQYRGATPQEDDWTMVMVDWTGPAPQQMRRSQ